MNDPLRGLQIHVYDCGDLWQACITKHPELVLFKSKKVFPTKEEMKAYAKQEFTRLLKV